MSKSVKPQILFQQDLFWESDKDTLTELNKWFDVRLLTPEMVLQLSPSLTEFRGSLTLAGRLKRLGPWTNALQWAPLFRYEMVTPTFHFQSLDAVLDMEISWPLFVRPASGNKTFAGNVYSKQKLELERQFLKQRGVPDTLICMVAEPKPITVEYRLIFIDGKYVSGSQYMVNGELAVGPIDPQAVKAGKQFFDKLGQPWAIIDVGLVAGTYRLVEVNQVETGSYYGADLEKIYKAWADALG